MSVKTNRILQALHIVSWIIFILVCFEAGAFICHTILMFAVDPENISKLWKEIDFTELFASNRTGFMKQMSFIIITSVLKAIMFYIILKIFNEKKSNLSKPFNETIRRFISHIAFLALGIGMFSFWGTAYAKNLIQNGHTLPEIDTLRLSGADVWLFMGVILLVIVHVFKKGIELQNENDLTV